MDDTEDDSRYPPNPYNVNDQQSYDSSRQKLPLRNAQYSRAVENQFADDYEGEDEEDEELGEDGENYQNNGVRYVGKDVDYDDEDEDDGGGGDEDDNLKNYNGGMDDVDIERHPKKA